MSETINLQAIQDKITEHKGQCSKIDAEAQKLVNRAKVLQDEFNEINKKLRQLNDMKIAQLAAVEVLTGLKPAETNEPKIVEDEPIPDEIKE